MLHLHTVMVPFLVHVVLGFGGRTPVQNAGYDSAAVGRVLECIREIEKAPILSKGAARRAVTLSEAELNAFIAYSFETGGEDVTRELRLKLLDDNVLEGKIRVDLRGTELPRFLRPDMTFFFSGRLETRDGEGRLDLKQLFLEKQPIPVSTLDLVIFAASRISNTEATTLQDWYPLPYGVLEISISRGKAVFYY